MVAVFAAHGRRFRLRKDGGFERQGQRFRPTGSEVSPCRVSQGRWVCFKVSPRRVGWSAHKVSPRRVGGCASRFRPVRSVGALKGFAP